MKSPSRDALNHELQPEPSALGMIDDYPAALNFLMGRINYERLPSNQYSAADLKLDRMRTLLSLLGDPQESLPAVHIAGTKGKGSTAIMTAAILSAAGYRVGLFTSPHITRLEERMTVDGRPPCESEVVSLVNKLIVALQQMDAHPIGTPGTYFEILTAMAWLYFCSRDVDVVVLEVGLGGRLDATNLCRPVVSVITSISYDHTRLLGKTLSKIAAEKAGILKRSVPLVSGVIEADPQRVIRRIADERHVPVWQLGDSFSFLHEPLGENLSRPEMPNGYLDVSVGECCYLGIPLPVLGRHQAHNAALAVAAITQMKHAGWNIPDEALNQGLSSVSCPVRMEVLRHNPTVILDAAHNTASARAVAETIDTYFPDPRKGLIFAVTRDKPAKAMLRLLLPSFDWIVLTQYLNNPRGLDYRELVQIARSLSDREFFTAGTPTEAWKLASAHAGNTDLICGTGSFFIAAELRDLLLSTQERENNAACDAPLPGMPVAP